MTIDKPLYREPREDQYSPKWRAGIDRVNFANTDWDDKLWVSKISFPEEGYDGDNSMATLNDLDTSSRSLVLDPDDSNGKNFPPGHLQVQENSQHDYPIINDETSCHFPRFISSLETSNASAASITHNFLGSMNNSAPIRYDIHKEDQVSSTSTLSRSQTTQNLRNPVTENSNDGPSLATRLVVTCSFTGKSGYIKRKYNPENYDLITSPSNTDVLFGRGARVNFHPGNIRFRNIVKERHINYHSLELRAEKTQFSGNIIHQVHSYGGRFLIRHEGTSEKNEKWIEANFEKTRIKVSQALRDEQQR